MISIINILQNKIDLLVEQVTLLQKMMTTLTKNNVNINDNKNDTEKSIPILYNNQLPIKDYYNSNHPKLEEEIKNIEKAIQIATQFDGCVFGGYVRNVVVPRLYGKQSPGFKDVDFWFKTQYQADCFVNALPNLLKLNDHDVQFQQDVYLFERKQYLYNHFVIFDIIISPTLPVNDFDVNQLTYSGNGFKSYGVKNANELCKLINKKYMSELPEYNPGKMSTKRRHVQNMRLEKFRSMGWTIFTYNHL